MRCEGASLREKANMAGTVNDSPLSIADLDSDINSKLMKDFDGEY